MNALVQRQFGRAIDPSSVERPLCIEAGELQIDAMGHYCGTSGTLLSVKFNGQHWAPARLREWLDPAARNHLGNWSRDLTAEEIAEAAE